MKLLFENWQNYLEENDDEKESQTMEKLLGKLEELLKKWPACDSDPESLACKYHKDLEEVVKEFGGTGCPAGSHEDEKVEEACGDDIGKGPSRRIRVMAAENQNIDET